MGTNASREGSMPADRPPLRLDHGTMTPPPPSHAIVANDTPPRNETNPDASEGTVPQALHLSSFAPELRVHTAFPVLQLNPDLPHLVRFQSVLEIVTREESQDSRMPFELCLLLDVSGSMAGAKLANLKEGVTKLLLMLKDHDLIHIIAYHNTPRVLVANRTKADLTDILIQLQNLVAEGGTNVSAALELTTQHLVTSRVRRHQQEQQHEATASQPCLQYAAQHVFLYTDGQPMEGLTTLEDLSTVCHDTLQNHNIHTSTFGVGTDVNGPLLEAMADAGGGEYAFVTVRRIEELSRKALMCLSRVVATRGEIDVALVVPGSLLAVPTAAEDRTHTISIGDLREGNVRRVGCALDLPPAAQRYLLDAARDAPGVPVALAHIVMSCQPVDAPLRRYVQELDVCCIVAETTSGDVMDPTISSTANDTSVQLRQRNEDAHPIVRVTFALAEMSAYNERALALLRDDGVETVQGAIQMLRDGLATLQAVEPLDDRGFVTTAIRRVERTLHRLRMRGLRDAPRVALELHMHQHTFDHQSDGGFQASDADNHSFVGVISPRRHSPRDVPALPFLGSAAVRRRQSLLDWGSDDGLDTGDLLRSPPHSPARSDTPRFFPSADRGRRSPPSTLASLPSLRDPTLRPITIPLSLRDAVAAAERGDSNAPHVPPEFMCTITQQLMDDPVMTCDGHTYQRTAIAKWIEDGNISSPLTGLSLCDLELRPNIALRSMISNWRSPKN